MRRSTFIAVLLGLLAITGVALAADKVSSNDPPPAPPKTDAVSPTLKENYAIFREPTSAKPPAAETKRFADSANNVVGANPELARTVQIKGLPVSETIAPGKDGLCLLEAGANSSSAACGSEQQAAAGKLILITVCGANATPGSVRVTGVVPDNVRSVALKDASGQTQKTAPTRNAFGFEITSSGESLTYTHADGTTQTVPATTPEPVKCATAPSPTDRGADGE